MVPRPRHPRPSHDAYFDYGFVQTLSSFAVYEYDRPEDEVRFGDFAWLYVVAMDVPGLLPRPIVCTACAGRDFDLFIFQTAEQMEAFWATPSDCTA